MRLTPSKVCLPFSGNFFEILSAPFAHSLSLFFPWKMALTVDDILEKIGSLGLYQLRLIFILSYIQFAMSLQVRMWCEIVSCIWYRIFLSFKRCFNLLFERNVSKNSHWTEPIYIRVGHVSESRVFRQQRFNRFLRCYWFSGKQKAILFQSTTEIRGSCEGLDYWISASIAHLVFTKKNSEIPQNTLRAI